MSTATRSSERRPDLDSVYSINPDGSRNRIHPAPVSGRFQLRKKLIWFALIAIYLVLPWITINGKPAVLIDIARRHFYLFGQTFNAQDFWLAFFFVTGIGFSLFIISALFGRIWCGYACPHTVFLEGVFRRLEKWIEGSPRKRQELDKGPWNREKIIKRGGKYVAFLAISLFLSHSFLSYFIPVDEVFRAVISPPSENLSAFIFILLFTAIIFANFTWFREQLCIVVCPYGRLQGSLYDQQTINVGYDRLRGEPRGKLGSETGGGDCIDCFRCVAVCPTGIDIRNGTQLECIGCADCVDACDAVMDKIGKPRGLVRYDSLAGLQGEPRKFLRPRVGLYAALLVLGVSVFAFAASRRTAFEANLLRMQASPWLIDGDTITNPLTLHLINKYPNRETFKIEARLPEGVTAVISLPEITLDSLKEQHIPVFVKFSRSQSVAGKSVELVIRSSKDERVIPQLLLGPKALPR